MKGWGANLKADLFQVVPEIDLKRVGLAHADFLTCRADFAGWLLNAFERDLEKNLQTLSELGIKIFK